MKVENHDNRKLPKSWVKETFSIEKSRVEGIVGQEHGVRYILRRIGFAGSVGPAKAQKENGKLENPEICEKLKR